MEMSVIAAKNIANMAYRDWKGVLNDKPTNKLKHLINQEQNDEIYKKEL